MNQDMAHDGTTVAFDQSDAGRMTHAITKVTQAWLSCGVVAGPLFIVAAGIQVLTRPGFDLRHHAVSLLSNGDLG